MHTLRIWTISSFIFNKHLIQDRIVVDLELNSGVRYRNTPWIGCQPITGHHAHTPSHTYIYTLRQFSIVDPPADMFESGREPGEIHTHVHCI